MAGPKADFVWAVQVSAAASLLAFVRAALLGLRRRDGWLNLAFRAGVWGPISATVPGAAALALSGLRRWLRRRRGRSPAQWVWAFFRGGARVWVVLEMLHFVHFQVKLRTLSRLRHLPPRTRQAQGRRMAALSRCLRNLELAMQPQKDAAQPQPADVGGGGGTGALRYRSDDNFMQRSLTAEGPVAGEDPSSRSSGQRPAASGPLGRVGLGMPRSSSMPFKRLPGMPGTLSRRGSSANLKVFPSAESLLRLWQDAGGDDAEGSDGEEERLTQLKRADISGWFCGADVTQLGRGNVKEWLAEAFFHGAAPEEIPFEDRGELEEMVTFMAKWIGLPDMPNVHNPLIHCKRLSRDPVKAVHRPFWVYGITSWVIPMVTDVICHRMGFEKFTAGVIQYWHRPARFPYGSGSGKTRSIPAVFCHGLGVGVLPYIQFVADIGASGLELFLLDLPHISMRQDSDVPSPRETVACVVDMLAAWGHSEAHFVGHSFGSIVVSWMLQNSRVVTSAALLDPVCFLLIKHDILTNALYKEHEDPLQVTLTYFVFRELYVAHTLARNFFWQQNDLAPETLRRPTLVLLSGKDAIVPAYSVRCFLRAEQERRKNFKRLGSPSAGRKLAAGGPSKIASCVDLASASMESETEARIAKTPLELVWYPDIVHCEFIAKPEVQREVVQAIHTLFAESAAAA